jgi:hypothetical protein
MLAMTHLLALFVVVGLMQTPSSQPLSQQRAGLLPEVLITTLSAEEIAKRGASQPLEHDTEVQRHEAITVIVTIAECTKDAKGTCNASADVVAYKPDGSVHSEMKTVSLNTGRGTASLKLLEGDATGLYKVVATVRDLNARRFGKAERSFGVR